MKTEIIFWFEEGFPNNITSVNAVYKLPQSFRPEESDESHNGNRNRNTSIEGCSEFFDSSAPQITCTVCILHNDPYHCFAYA